MIVVDRVLGWLMRPPVRRVLRWSFVVTLPLCALLVSIRGVETVLALFALEFAAFLVVIVVATRMGGERGQLILDLVMHPAGRRLFASELTILVTLPRALLRAFKGGSPNEFPYAKGEPELPIAIAFIPAVAAEVAVVHLLLPDSLGWLKLALLVGSVYGLLWILGWAVGLRAFPHRLYDDRLELRLGGLYRAVVALDAIAAVHVARDKDGPRTRLDVRGDEAALRVGGRVDVRLDLDRPAIVQRPFGEPLQVTSIAFAVDDAADLAARVERQRPSQTTTSTRSAPGGARCRALARS